MITLFIEYTVIQDKQSLFEDLMQDLTKGSLTDKGCIRYQYYKHPQDTNRFVLWEQWENETLLEEHGMAPHFTRIVPQIREICSMEKFTFKD